jgi:hypothetical protein
VRVRMKAAVMMKANEAKMPGQYGEDGAEGCQP